MDIPAVDPVQENSNTQETAKPIIDHLQDYPDMKAKFASVRALSDNLKACYIKAVWAKEANDKDSSECKDSHDSGSEDPDAKDPPPAPPKLSPLELNVIQIRRNLQKVGRKIWSVNHDPEVFFSIGLGGVVDDLNDILTKVLSGEIRPQTHVDFDNALAKGLKVPEPPCTIVDTRKEVEAMLEAMRPAIVDSKPGEPVLAVDTEGRISMIQIFVPALNHVFLIGVHPLPLDDSAFTISITVDDHTISLKSILEDANIPKLFYDCRGDSASLFHHQHAIELAGVIDVQLMDNATRLPKERKRVRGLLMAVTQRMNRALHPDPLHDFHRIKLHGRLAMLTGYENAQRFWDKHMGSLPDVNKEVKRIDDIINAPGYDRATGEGEFGIVDDPFKIRPLPEMLRKYAMRDAYFLTVVYEHNPKHRRYNDEWHERVFVESERRAKLGRSEEWEGMSGDERKAPPEGWIDVPVVERGVVPDAAEKPVGEAAEEAGEKE